MSESSVLKRGDRVDMDRCQHYFIKDAKGMVGCVAITPMALEGPYAGRICRGISLCSEKDSWDRDAGYKKAVARIRRAVGTEGEPDPKEPAWGIQNDDNPIVARFYKSEVAGDIFETIPMCGHGCCDNDAFTVLKVAYNVSPTERELGILYHLVKRLGGTPIEPFIIKNA